MSTRRPPPREFEVLPPPGEQARLEMDRGELQSAARIAHGPFYTFENADRLLADLPPGRQVRVESLPDRSLWNSSWLAALLIGLLTVEWLLRRRAGML
jgi:hypothetical protein